MTATAAAFLNKAKQQVGFREGPNNDNPYGIWYGWNHVAYCAIGLTWVGYHVGAEEQIGGKWAYCPYWADWFRKRGQWSDISFERGDIVFFDWTGRRQHGNEQHVGAILGRVDSSHIQTVEFNTGNGINQSDGDGVWVRTRHISLVVGAGKPKWAPESNVTPIINKGHEILIVDGVWGARTTRRLQEVVGALQDGELGPQTYGLLAKWLSQKATGTFTLSMKTALQYRVGVAQDGVIGPITVRALQRYLNRL